MNLSKLAQLRSKTDLQLLAVINRKLEAGRDYARRGCLAQAKNAYREARALLPVAGSLSQIERYHLQSKLARLGEALDERSARIGVPLETNACI